MKILFISASPINYQISTGNTFLNFFAGMKNIELTSIYSRKGYPDFRYISRAFQITDISLIKGILNRKCNGTEINCKSNFNSDDRIEDNVIERTVKKHSSEWLYVIRNLLWKLAPWEKSGVIEFIRDVNPDIVFTLFSKDTALNDLISFVLKNSNAKLVLYACDDHYSYLKKSPLLVLKKIINRRKMRKILNLSDKMYVISDIQKSDYEKEFKKELTVLTKGADFDTFPEKIKSSNDIIQMVYTGNLVNGRWKTLALLAEKIKNINEKGQKIVLKIYSATQLTVEMKKRLSIGGSSYLMGGVPSNEINQIQENADILVHAEAFDSKNKMIVRQSFSTKIVDYLHQAKCIFAVGPADVASMDYLIQNDAALTATNEAEIEEALRKVINNKDLLTEYGKKAWECGKRNHQIKDIQAKLYRDFEEILNKNSAIK